jgi:hypothetical protein
MRPISPPSAIATATTTNAQKPSVRATIARTAPTAMPTTVVFTGRASR